MRKKLLCLIILAVSLTACGNKATIKEVHISAEDFLEYTTEEMPASSDDADYSTSESAPENDFTETGYFQEYAKLAAPDSVSGIEYVGREIDRYIFVFPDDETMASKLYNEYGALIQEAGFTLEEYEGNYIIKDGSKSIAFMGTGHNAEHKYMMMMAFYPEK